jgi:uncharacterized protein
MRFSDYEWVAAVIDAHPSHKVCGRTRLQKTVKLLQRLGLPTSYGFTIHYYGPYSEDLQSDIGLLEQFGLVSEEGQVNQQGDPYYVFRANSGAELPDVSQFKTATDKIAQADAIVLELAATYDAFLELGADEAEAMERLRRKKGRKCEEGRAERALSLLNELKLLKEPVAA